MRVNVVFTCALCGATLDTQTSSQEKAGQIAAQQRWLVGLPRNTVFCYRCAFLAAS